MRLRPSLLPLLLPVLLLPTACGRNGITNQPASLVSSSSLWLRNTYDTDPSIYVGRFVPAGVTDLDESNTMVLACSKYITARFIDGGGVEYSEQMQVSTDVALKIGLPVVASGSAGYESSRTARAQYTMTGKLVAEITDPEGFAACCKAQPDQCTDRFIGEFIQGTGSLHHDAERSVELEGQGTNPTNGLSGEGGVSRSAEWQRAAEFPNPVYFAFKVNPTPYTQGLVDTCPSWVEQPPAAVGGVYVIGSADKAWSETNARSAALQNAGGMAAQAVGVSVAVRPESWCVTASKNKRGKPRYNARVLGFVSDADIATAREQARIAAEQAAAQAAADRAAEQARLDAAAAGGGTEQPTETTDTTPTPTAGASDVDRILAAVEAEAASSDRLSALKFSLKDASLTAADAKRVLDAFASGEDKLEALRIMTAQIEDPENWQVLVDAFSFSSDREAARSLAP